jgi:DNA-directed RNA polymerase subunit RPC12/RpoP
MTMNKTIIRQAFEAGESSQYDEFQAWLNSELVEYTCNDCGKQVIRTRVEWLDIDGITPHRCVSCTLDAMAEQ